MTKKSIPRQKKLAALYASFAILIMGATSLLESMSLDYYSVVGTLEKVIPAALVLGGLGWVMGMVLDSPRRRGGLGHNAVFLNNVIKEVNINEENSSESGSETRE